jgi:hypothetical protein
MILTVCELKSSSEPFDIRHVRMMAPELSQLPVCKSMKWLVLVLTINQRLGGQFAFLRRLGKRSQESSFEFFPSGKNWAFFDYASSPFTKIFVETIL